MTWHDMGWDGMGWDVPWGLGLIVEIITVITVITSITSQIGLDPLQMFAYYFSLIYCWSKEEGLRYDDAVSK
jgi:hypothetical protein